MLISLSNITDNTKIQNNPISENNLEKENISWIELSNRIKSWDNRVYQRISKRSNPAGKKILKLLKDIDPDNPSTWIDFRGRTFQRLIQASFEYDKKRD